MKNLFALGLMVVCFLTSQSISAQTTVVKPADPLKPVSLAQLPSKAEFALSSRNITRFRMAEKVVLPMGDAQFAGEVVGKVQPAAGVVSFNIRSTNVTGALCTISVITEADQTQKLVGRIVNPKSSDVLVLTEENNRYYWVKQPKQFFMTE